MELLKKVNVLVLGLAVLLAVSCGDDEKKKEDPAPVVATPSMNNCKLTKITLTDPSPQPFEELIYDTQGKHIGTKVYPSEMHSAFEYNAKGEVIRRAVYDKNNDLMGYAGYNYNSASLLTSITQVNVRPFTELVSTAELTYNPAQQLIKIEKHITQGSPVFETDSVFYLAGNVIRFKKYEHDANNTNFVLKQTAEYRFDNHKSAFKNFRHLYFMDNTNGDLLPVDNNIIQIKTTAHLINNTQVQDFTYQYNSGNYPVSWVRNVDNGLVATGTFNYNCQ